MHLLPKTALSLTLGLSFSFFPSSSFAFPQPEDIPEEILRTQIITEARSSLDGHLMSPEQYALLVEQLQTSSFPPTLNPNINRLIFLLQLRQFIRVILPVF